MDSSIISKSEEISNIERYRILEIMIGGKTMRQSPFRGSDLLKIFNI